MVGAVLGAIVGAAIPGGLQLAEGAAATADSDSLRSVASDYLAAIAEGRASDATAMVPLPRPAGEVSDIVLQSAERIDDAAVRLVHIDGDAALVEVAYDVGQHSVTRMLDAERADGGWRITTSLAERVIVQMASASARPQIAGIPIPLTIPVHLYPGTYAFDDTSDATLRTSNEPFTLDGDEATTTEVYFQVQLEPEAAAQAGDIGVALAAQCQAQPGCSIPPELEVEASGEPWVQLANGNSIDVAVPLMSSSATNGRWFDARMRIMLDASGAPLEWLCAPIDHYDTPSEPCPAVE